MCLWADLNQCQLHSQGKNEWQYEHPTMPNWQLKLQEIIMFHVILILCGKFDIIFCRLSSSSQLESSIPLGDFQLSLPKKSSHLSPSQAVQVVFEVVTSWHCQSWKDLRPNPKTSQNISKTSQGISKDLKTIQCHSIELAYRCEPSQVTNRAEGRRLPGVRTVHIGSAKDQAL